MLGGKGRSLVMMGVFILTAGFSFENYYLITAALFFIFATFVSLPGFDSKMNIGDLTVQRILTNKKVFQDDFLHVKVQVTNEGGTRFDFLEFFDDFDTDVFRIVVGENYISTRVDPHKTITYSYILQPKVRGEFTIGPISVTVKDRLGFNAETRRVPESVDDIVIYPRYEQIKMIEALGAKRAMNMSFGIHKTKQVGSGNELRGLRQYVFGDQFRYIDWKASLRTQELIVREFETESNLSVVIIIDASESMAGGAVENTKFEYSILSAMLLSKIAIDQQDTVALVLFSDEDGFRFLPSSKRKDHFFEILDFVANITPSGKKKIFWSMDQFVRRFQRRSLIFVLTDLEVATKDIDAAMRKLRTFEHSVTIVAPFSPWFEVHETELGATDKALAEAISEEMMQHILQVKKNCQKLLVPVISVGPDDMFNVIMQEYENAKKYRRAE